MAIRQQEHPSSEEASEKKKHGTTYMSPEGKEITFVQARDKKLDLDRDVGKMRVWVERGMNPSDHYGLDEGKRAGRILVRCVQVQFEGQQVLVGPHQRKRAYACGKSDR